MLTRGRSRIWTRQWRSELNFLVTTMYCLHCQQPHLGNIDFVPNIYLFDSFPELGISPITFSHGPFLSKCKENKQFMLLILILPSLQLTTNPGTVLNCDNFWQRQHKSIFSYPRKPGPSVLFGNCCMRCGMRKVIRWSSLRETHTGVYNPVHWIVTLFV